jgi:hypothetical protein
VLVSVGPRRDDPLPVRNASGDQIAAVYVERLDDEQHLFGESHHALHQRWCCVSPDQLDAYFTVERYRASVHTEYAVFDRHRRPLGVFTHTRPLIGEPSFEVHDGSGAPIARVCFGVQGDATFELLGGGYLGRLYCTADGVWPRDLTWHLELEALPPVLDAYVLIATPLVCCINTRVFTGEQA